jgi:hypothetical protein
MYNVSITRLRVRSIFYMPLKPLMPVGGRKRPTCRPGTRLTGGC